MFENVMTYYKHNKKYLVLIDEYQESFIVYDTEENKGKVINDTWVIDSLMDQVVLDEDTVIKKSFFDNLKEYFEEMLALDEGKKGSKSILAALQVVNII